MKSFKDLVTEVKKCTERVEFEVPAEFEEDASHFIGAASRAHKKGKKEFKLGGKTYPVTIKKPVTEETVWNKAAKEVKTIKDKMMQRQLQDLARTLEQIGRAPNSLANLMGNNLMDKLNRQLQSLDTDVRDGVIQKFQKVGLMKEHLEEGYGHEERIARDTVKNPAKGLLGGPNASEAERILRTKYKYDDKRIAKLKEDVDPKDKGEYDFEGEMAKDYLETAKRGIEALMGMIKDDQNLPEWVQAKIVKASDYIDTVADYMMSQGDEQINEVKDPRAVVQKKLSDIQRKKEQKPMSDTQYDAEKQRKIKQRDAEERARRAKGLKPLYKLSTEETINEVLTADDPMEKWIDDFQKSDDPKFDGKSKEKRREMAIAAKLQADREAGKDVPPKKEGKSFKEYMEAVYRHKGTYGSSYKAHDDKYDDYEDKKSYAKRLGISPAMKKPAAKSATSSTKQGRGRPVGSTSGAQSRVRKI